MQRAGLIVPTRVYPLFENRVAHESGVGPDQSLADSVRMYSAFSELAAKNPASWTSEVYSAEEIATVGPGNRMVCEPYPLMLNAMPFVDQAAATLVCSLAVAREHGVPEDRTVYLWGGAGATDPVDVLSRNGFGTSTAMTDAVHRALSRASIDASALDIVDAYSCFPVVPKLLTRTLGLPESIVPSVTGGHSFFGGPLNSYTLHSIAEVTRRLREGAGPALVHGNGGYLTYQHVVLLAGAPHPGGYVGDPAPVQLRRRRRNSSSAMKDEPTSSHPPWSTGGTAPPRPASSLRTPPTAGAWPDMPAPRRRSHVRVRADPGAVGDRADRSRHGPRRHPVGAVLTGRGH